ncbi:hypothetical protein PSTT_15954, partial [Puccinia striiformis]
MRCTACLSHVYLLTIIIAINASEDLVRNFLGHLASDLSQDHNHKAHDCSHTGGVVLRSTQNGPQVTQEAADICVHGSLPETTLSLVWNVGFHGPIHKATSWPAHLSSNMKSLWPRIYSETGWQAGYGHDLGNGNIEFFNLLKEDSITPCVSRLSSGIERNQRKINHGNEHVSKSDNTPRLGIDLNPPAKRFCKDNVSKSQNPSGLEIDSSPSAKRLCGGSRAFITPETGNEDLEDLRDIETIQNSPDSTPKNDDIHLTRLESIDFLNR